MALKLVKIGLFFYGCWELGGGLACVGRTVSPPSEPTRSHAVKNVCDTIEAKQTIISFQKFGPTQSRGWIYDFGVTKIFTESLAYQNRKMAGNSITALSIIERIFSNWKALEEIVVVGKVHDFEMMDKVRYFCQSFAIVVSMEDKLDYREICIDLKDVTNMIFNKSLTDNSEKEIAKQIMLFHECKVKNDIESLKAEFQRLPVLRKWIIS